MQRIADAVKHHDADALKNLFSSRARDEATDLDGGLSYFSVNDYDPDNTGIYALGITPHTASPTTASGASQPFDTWASQFGISDKDHLATGDPVVYIPQD